MGTPASPLTASIFTIPQPEPKEGRLAIPLVENNGNSSGITFVTGDEIFSWNSDSLQGPQKPSSILAFWVDATNLTAGSVVYITIGNQTFFIPTGQSASAQGYYICTSSIPANVTVKTKTGVAGTLQLILYNYNVAFTGRYGAADNAVSSQSAGVGRPVFQRFGGR